MDTEDSLAVNGQYVGDVWLAAIARVLGRDIIVLMDTSTESGEPWKTKYLCRPGSNEDENPLVIGHINSNHYVAFMKRQVLHTLYIISFILYFCMFAGCR